MTVSIRILRNARTQWVQFYVKTVKVSNGGVLLGAVRVAAMVSGGEGCG